MKCLHTVGEWRGHVKVDLVAGEDEAEVCVGTVLPDLFSRRVSHSLVFLFILLSSISGGEALINGNSESNLPVIH